MNLLYGMKTIKVSATAWRNTRAPPSSLLASRLPTIGRGGVTVRVEFTNNFGASNWETVAGTITLIPYSDGSICTPKTWANLPRTSQQRFFRIATQ